MLVPDSLLPVLGLAAFAAPLVASALIGSTLFLVGAPSERLAHRTVVAALVVVLGATSLAGLSWWTSGREVLDVDLGMWFAVAEHHFPFGVRLDEVSVPVSVAVAIISMLIARFAVHYMHREKGYARFFMLFALATGGLELVVLAGGFDPLFVGWELLGLSSIMLVMFFQERPGPPVAGLRVLLTYRLCDVGLVLGALVLHHATGSTQYSSALAPAGLARIDTDVATLIALGLLLAAMGKSAQFPVGGWLPRAMEGPTASSALFYGALSVHGGVLLLLRAEPLLEASPLARAAVAVVGAVTALHAAVVGRVQADAKGQLAYATMAQVGLMFVEVAAGLPRVAVLHLVSHAFLRGFQLLRTPNTLRDAREISIALGQERLPQEAAIERALPIGAAIALYRLALQRFYLEAIFSRFLVGPVLALASWLDRAEARFVARVFGARAAAALAAIESTTEREA